MNAMVTIQQLCGGNGNRLVAMIGAHSFLAGKNELHFQFKGSRAANRVKIELNAFDLYDVTFFAGRGVNVREVERISNVPAENLRRVFVGFTGLDVSL
jgi:hypothetical protein